VSITLTLKAISPIGIDVLIIGCIVGKSARVVENQLFESTNNGESLRLAVNNTLHDTIMFMHGDLIISEGIFDKIDLSKSFLLIDDLNKFEEKEVGVTVVNNIATVLSYNLPTKWCQIAYLSPNETAILRKIFAKPDLNTKFLLTFEIINKIIEMGGSFECYNIGNNYIKEIDRNNCCKKCLKIYDLQHGR